MTISRNLVWPETRCFRHDASIVLVGSRGAGKRSLGFIGAAKLGWKLITEDQCFLTVTGISRRQYLQLYGSEKFYVQNVEVLKHMLLDNKERCVIECGMGSLAGKVQDLLREYSETNPVIYITRSLKSLSLLLRLDVHDAERLDKADQIHRSCSNFEYYNLWDSAGEANPNDTPGQVDRGSPQYSFKLKSAKEDFSRFLNAVTGQQSDKTDSPFSIAAVAVEHRLYTYKFCIRLSEFMNGGVDFNDLELDSGGDVVEVKIDVVPPANLKIIAKMVATIRRRLQLPVALSITRHIRADLGEKGSLELLHYAIRLCIEYIVVDSDVTDAGLKELLRLKARTKVIWSFRDRQCLSSSAWTDGFFLKQYMRAKDLGCDLINLSRIAIRGDDQREVMRFVQNVKDVGDVENSPALIAYNFGAMGFLSQVLNPTFTPVTTINRSDIGILVKRDAESLTAREAMQALYAQGVLDRLHFYVVGASVSYSLSPALHQAAYNACGMNHTYDIIESSSLEELQRVAQSPSFGGASISHPFKTNILPRLMALSKHAEAIGAVNTVVPLRRLPDGSEPDNTLVSLLSQAKHRGRAGPVVGWYGDNTDFIGIMTCVQRNLSPRNSIHRKSTGLVIGAGGMARAAIYAMFRLGCRKVFICNRTVSNAQKIAHHFNSQEAMEGIQAAAVIDSLNTPWPKEYNLPTIIVSAIPAHSFDGQPEPKLELPEAWLQSPTGGVVIELAYKPFVTPLMQQIRHLQECGRSWTAVDGLEILPEQAIAQFELMTGRRAPRGQMRLEVLRRFHKEAEERAEYDGQNLGDK